MSENTLNVHTYPVKYEIAQQLYTVSSQASIHSYTHTGFEYSASILEDIAYLAEAAISRGIPIKEMRSSPATKLNSRRWKSV